MRSLPCSRRRVSADAGIRHISRLACAAILLFNNNAATFTRLLRTMTNIVALLSQYELLKRIANFLSTLDLFYLALTNSKLHTLIRKSEPIFDRLKSVALCDGHGLKMRQEFKGIYELRAEDYVWRTGRKAHYDGELEVRVWNLNCDSTNGLPCLRCGVNVCEVSYLNYYFKETALIISGLGMSICPPRSKYAQNAFLSETAPPPVPSA
jgi:hypothetical protein